MEIKLTPAVIACLKRGLNCWPQQNYADGLEIKEILKPLDAMMLSHNDMAALVLKHEQQIKDLAAHLLELIEEKT